MYFRRMRQSNGQLPVLNSRIIWWYWAASESEGGHSRHCTDTPEHVLACGQLMCMGGGLHFEVSALKFS